MKLCASCTAQGCNTVQALSDAGTAIAEAAWDSTCSQSHDEVDMLQVSLIITKLLGLDRPEAQSKKLDGINGCRLHMVLLQFCTTALTLAD